MDRSYETHRYAEIFPNMASDEFEELVKDIRANRLIEPITMLDGKVLDGRSRLKACIEAGVEPRFVEFDGHMDPLMFVWSKNFARRHLTLKQRVLLALKFRETVEAAAKERMSKGGKISAAAKAGQGVTNLSPLEENEKGKSVDKLADMADVSRGTMQAALAVERDAPELLAEVEAGKLSVSAAAKQAKAKKDPEGAGIPHISWKKVVADCEKLNADLSAFELSEGMPEIADCEKLRIVAERILAYLATFDKGPGK